MCIYRLCVDVCGVCVCESVCVRVCVCKKPFTLLVSPPPNQGGRFDDRQEVRLSHTRGCGCGLKERERERERDRES